MSSGHTQPDYAPLERNQAPALATSSTAPNSASKVSPGRGERGAGTILVVVLIAILVIAATAAMVVVGWFGAGRKAQEAADLAALAGAGAYQSGGEPCEAAKSAADKNGAELTACEFRGHEASFVIEVTVKRSVDTWPGMPDFVTGEAAAGRT